MMLYQKPSPINMSSPAQFSHRRHPSAPVVVVQPTRTPGLLSLSKPVRPTPPRQQPQQKQHNLRPSPKNHTKPTQGVVRAQALTPPAEIVEKSSVAYAPVTPPRGRSQAKHLKTKRSESQSALRGKHGRQPSPPIPTSSQPVSSQAEATIISNNAFDPFLDNVLPPSPTLTSRPSGKLAQRRQPTQPLSVPFPPTSNKMPAMARSAPVPSNMKRLRPLTKRSSTVQEFPICDDSSEYDPAPASLTPRRLYDNGPQTAPLSAGAPGTFPFTDFGGHSISAPPPSPNSPKKSRKHRRTPSEGVFHMSSDEEVSSGPGGYVLNPQVKSLFGLANVTPMKTSLAASPFVTPPSSRTVTPRARDSSPSGGSLPPVREGNEKAGFFASSTFQNSPSPDELPDPLLL
ncbi:hypothetical protein CPB83DRAFT_869382 [Crepidotus variabilis]|uniref:Uncharacterized protein n=1 Tax=Crepidotus variabilis TaxID=179855 RepID=A0A9P6EH30_9AGAR|nr:hypothetical protein CPB83DRAFT_869382 [Crepidotus variabilis]